MQKKLPIIAALVIVLLGGVVYTQFTKSSKSPEVKTEEAKNVTENNVTGTIKSILEGGKTLKCAVDYSQEENGGKGTVYVAGKKMRADLISDLEGKTMESHVIYDENYSYIWSSNQADGVKMKITEEDLKESEEFKNESIDLEKEGKIQCSPWVSDNAKFNPPSNIKFADLTEMMDSLKPKTNGETNTAVCDQIPDPSAKAECVKALNQN